MSSEDLKTYLKKMGVSTRFFRFAEHTMTVEAAELRLGVSREKIIKSMVFMDEAGHPMLGIVTGEKRVNEKKLAAVSGANKVTRANADQVKAVTGYGVGAVPPVGHKMQIRTFIDEKVMTFDRVIGGGGETNTLLEIRSADIKRLTMGDVKDISA